MYPTSIRERAKQLATDAAACGYTLEHFIENNDDAERVTRKINEHRTRSFSADFAALVSKDPRAAAKQFLRSPSDTQRMLHDLEQDQLITWVKALNDDDAAAVIDRLPDPAFVISRVVPDAEVPRFVIVRNAGLMAVATEPLEINAAVARKLIAAGVDVREPRSITTPPEPHHYLGMSVGEATVYSIEAWNAILSVDAKARAYLDAGHIIVEDLPMDQCRIRLCVRLTARGR